MSETEFDMYLESSVQDYAQEHVKAGNWNAEKAMQLAEQSFHKLLPDGFATQNQHLLSIEDETLGTKVGILWFAVQDHEAEPRAFVYDVQIYEQFRQRGYGTQAFQALEEKVQKLGLSTITLHVFGHNHAARAMYEKLGYVTIDLIMSKTLKVKSG
ncbi:MAG TPA: GNAT family N-acetyltransferase [Candidatus Fraserbacteria bacterium]|nr:GNAT family N-acetyltransferase [Candidatus Fraserbacteria bacterium]